MMAAPRNYGAHQSRRISIALSCSICNNRNYKTKQPPLEGRPALKLKKFCSHCNQHTMHVEGR
jgi:large subunit ribosomal protein L33